MKRLEKLEAVFEACDRYVSILLGILLAFMSIFIFTNVVLRYVFNSGLDWAEELTRFLFVWATFLGAVLALKDNNHLGFTSVVQKMPQSIKKLMFLASSIMILYVLLDLFMGSIKMIPIGMLNTGASTGIPMAVMYAVGIPMCIMMAFIIANNIYKAVFIKGAVEELISLKESEEEITFK